LNALPEPQNVYNGQPLEIPEITTEDVMKKLKFYYLKKPRQPPQVCRILESILKDHIVEHLEINKFINDTQHGFRAKNPA